jgi:transposase InsO family protein
VAYVEALPDERDATCAGFLYRAVTWFRERGVQVLRILTDNAKVYRVGRNWRAVCVGLGIRRRFTRPGCPWTNGKAERFNRTLLAEFAYAQPWLSNHDRLAALDSWVDRYNTRRAHSALGGRPPATRLAA